MTCLERIVLVTMEYITFSSVCLTGPLYPKTQCGFKKYEN